MFLGVYRNQPSQFRTSIQQPPENLIVSFPLFPYRVPFVKALGSLGGKSRERLAVKLLGVLSGFFLGETWLPLHSRVLGLQTGSNLEIDSLADSAFCLHPMQPFFPLFENSFLLIQIKQKCSRLPI